MGQILEVGTAPLQKNILAPTSFDFTLRTMFLAAIYPGTIIIQNFNQSLAINKLLDCLQMIGLTLTRTDEAIIFHSSFPHCETQTDSGVPITIDIGPKNDGLYFLMALLIRGRGKYIINASHVKEEEDIKDPFFHQFLDLLTELKIKVKTPEKNLFPIEIQGPAVFHHRDFELASTYGSKAIEAITLCFCDTPLNFSSQIESPSWSLTQNIIKSFFFEKDNQNFSFFAPVDFSQVSYMALLALMTGHLIVRNCPFIDLMQAESALFGLIRKMKGHTTITAQGLTITKQLENLSPLEWDITHNVHIIAGLFVLCSKVKGKSTFENIKNLGEEEKKHCLKLLEVFEVPHKYDNSSDRLIIEGAPAKKCSYIEYKVPSSYPWLGMAAYLLMRINSGGKLSNIEEMNRTYPDFFQLII